MKKTAEKSATGAQSIIESVNGFYTLSQTNSKGEYISIKQIGIGEADRLIKTGDFEHVLIAKDRGKWVRDDNRKKTASAVIADPERIRAARAAAEAAEAERIKATRAAAKTEAEPQAAEAPEDEEDFFNN